MAKTFKSIKEILRDQRILNTLSDSKKSVFEDISDLLEIEENLDEKDEFDLAPLTYSY